MKKESSNILEEFQESAKLFEWENLYDITEATRQMPEDHYIIFNDWGGYTSISDNIAYVKVFCRKNKKILLIPKKIHEKLYEHLRFLANFGTVEEMIEIGKNLYKLYPDFNFFEI
jgi:hypothetical protein